MRVASGPFEWMQLLKKPIFHVILSDRDEWAVEVEWPDRTLERINTHKYYILGCQLGGQSI